MFRKISLSAEDGSAEHRQRLGQIALEKEVDQGRPATTA
ncbi:MAG: hypothetical protein ACD_75C00796G0001, partial [uncultured bacterium]